MIFLVITIATYVCIKLITNNNFNQYVRVNQMQMDSKNFFQQGFKFSILLEVRVILNNIMWLAGIKNLKIIRCLS